jgi:hypothetical protein
MILAHDRDRNLNGRLGHDEGLVKSPPSGRKSDYNHGDMKNYALIVI